LLLSLLFIALFCYLLTELVAESVVTLVPPAGGCHSLCTHCPHPPPPTVSPSTAIKGDVQGVPHPLVYGLDRGLFRRFQTSESESSGSNSKSKSESAKLVSSPDSTPCPDLSTTSLHFPQVTSYVTQRVRSGNGNVTRFIQLYIRSG